MFGNKKVYLRRLMTDDYDTNTRIGFNMVQEDWIAGSVDAIREYVTAIRKEMDKRYKDAGYIEEKLRKISNEIDMIEFRTDLILRPPAFKPFSNEHKHDQYCCSPCNE